MPVEDLRLEMRPPLTVEEFEALAEAQGWGSDTRVELLDGEVVPMPPVEAPHSGNVNRLTRVFSARLANVALASIQNPVRIDDYDELQPDVALLRPRADDYGTANPTAAD